MFSVVLVKILGSVWISFIRCILGENPDPG